MKGIILAGGNGTRLLPLTAVASKQLLPVYDRPMIFYPLNTLIQAGITDILIIVSPAHSGNYLNLLGSLLNKHGIHISFIVQKQPNGLAEAYILAEDFLDGGPSAMILGDNIFEDDFTDGIRSFEAGGRVSAAKVPAPRRSGVVESSEDRRVISIEEKPQSPKSDYAIPGIYIYDGRAAEFAKSLVPSDDRGELEIVDMHKKYLAEDALDVRTLSGAWFDTGTHDALLEASVFAKEHRLSEKFHPVINEAIAEYNAHIKRLVAVKQ